MSDDGHDPFPNAPDEPSSADAAPSPAEDEARAMTPAEALAAKIEAAARGNRAAPDADGEQASNADQDDASAESNDAAESEQQAADSEQGAGDQERSIALMLKARLQEIRDPESGESFDEIDEELSATLLALVLGELPKGERDLLLERAKRDPRVALELQRLSAHLSIHQKVSRVAPNRGSFSRLASRMKGEKLLGEVIPGRHSLWRRAVMAAAAVLVLVVLLNVVIFPSSRRPSGEEALRAKLTLNGEDGAQSKIVSFGELVSLDSGSGDLLLTTGGRGHPTKIRLAPNSRFVLESASVLRLERGSAQRVQVDPESTYVTGFSVLTPHARFVSTDGEFSVWMERDASFVSVLSGRVRAKPLNNEDESLERTVYRGHYYRIADPANAQMLEPRHFLEIQLAPTPDSKHLRVSFINRSGMELRILRPTGDWRRDMSIRTEIQQAAGEDDGAIDGPVFQATVDQDQRYEGEPVVGKTDHPIVLTPLGPGPSGTQTDDEARWLRLAADGAGSQVEFQAELSSLLGNLAEADYTVGIAYAGPIITEHFGEVTMSVRSLNLRLDLKKPGRIPEVAPRDEESDE